MIRYPLAKKHDSTSDLNIDLSLLPATSKFIDYARLNVVFEVEEEKKDDDNLVQCEFCSEKVLIDFLL